MQTIFGWAGLILLVFGGHGAKAEGIPDRGGMICMIGKDLGLVGWRTSTDGKVEMLGAMAGEVATNTGDGLIIIRDEATVVLRADQVVWSEPSGTTTGPCKIVTEDVIGMAEALK